MGRADQAAGLGGQKPAVKRVQRPTGMGAAILKGGDGLTPPDNKDPPLRPPVCDV